MEIATEELAALCRQFHVRQLDRFGSAADGRFDSACSDLDFLVTFEEDAPMRGFANAYFGLLEGLTDLFGRKVDLLMDRSIKNPYLRRSIEAQRKQVYPSL